jgi:hypothetical protein
VIHQCKLYLFVLVVEVQEVQYETDGTTDTAHDERSAYDTPAISSWPWAGNDSICFLFDSHPGPLGFLCCGCYCGKFSLEIGNHSEASGYLRSCRNPPCAIFWGVLTVTATDESAHAIIETVVPFSAVVNNTANSISHNALARSSTIFK